MCSYILAVHKLHINPFSAKPYIIITTHKAPNLSAVSETF